MFPPQQAATDLDKKETSHIHVFFPSPAEDERKECIQLLPKPQQVYSAAKTRSHGIAKLPIFAESAGRWSLVFAKVACMLASFLMLAQACFLL